MGEYTVHTLPDGYEYFATAKNPAVVEINGTKVRGVMTLNDGDNTIYLITMPDGTKLYRNDDSDDFYVDIGKGYYEHYAIDNSNNDE